MASLPLVLIAALARNGVIGRENALPWRIPDDMKQFKRLTMGKPLIMGRKTWESIGRPLPGRFPVVVSRNPDLRIEGVEVVGSLDAAIERASAIGHAHGADAIMVAGGGTLYAETIGRAERLSLTEVDLAPEGDTYFPPIDPALWHEIDREPHRASPRDDADYTFVTYART